MIAIDAYKESIIRGPPFVISFLDQHMPIKDGLAAAFEIQALQSETFLQSGQPSSYFPICALTADIQQEARDKSFVAGMKGHLTKPVRVSDLYQKIHQLLWENTVLYFAKNKQLKNCKN